MQKSLLRRRQKEVSAIRVLRLRGARDLQHPPGAHRVPPDGAHFRRAQKKCGIFWHNLTTFEELQYFTITTSLRGENIAILGTFQPLFFIGCTTAKPAVANPSLRAKPLEVAQFSLVQIHLDFALLIPQKSNFVEHVSLA